MDSAQLKAILDDLIARWENEVVEFKRAGDGHSTSDIGKYFSALANEANLRGLDRGWLVFGVDNHTRTVCGTEYRPQHERLHGLKMDVAAQTKPNITFREIHQLELKQGRVLLFEIPAAPCGFPIAWKGHYYARAGESLTSLGLDKLDTIRAQTAMSDWSAQVVTGATLNHLDQAALQQARKSFGEKYANRFKSGEVDGWSEATLLDRARLTVDGNITRSALLLLGRAETAHLLSPHPAQVVWKLDGPEKAYEHFGPPFLLHTTSLYRLIRNLQLRVLPVDDLLPVEVSKYDQKIVLEALHNCIAHQDYGRHGRVVVTEQPDRLIFESEGTFFEGQPGDYVAGARTPLRYRNPFLVQAMTELNMIDTMGYGIHEMFTGQARRFFPLPDYDLNDASVVRLTLHGRVIDPAYSRLLIQNTELPLTDILALDRIQKLLPLDDVSVRHLRRAGLVKGRKPNLYVSAAVAKATSAKADYIRMRAQDDTFYERLLTDYLDKFGRATRQEINRLLWDKLSDGLDEEQKDRKIGNLLTKLRRAKHIRNVGSRGKPVWTLAE